MEIFLDSISKNFKELEIFHKMSMKISSESSLAILGDSGKGKSTLLNILALFEKIDKGKIYIDGVDVQEKSFDKVDYWRYRIGYIFQNYALIDNASIDKNLDIALEYTNKSKYEKNELKKEVLEKVGLLGKEKKAIYTLSGGEQQRVAIARVLLKPCEIVLADEPTGALDSNNKREVIKLLEMLKNEGKSLVIVTHDDEVAKVCDSLCRL